MDAEPNAVELTVEQAWCIAETIGAGTFPWVLAITTPYYDVAHRAAFMDQQAAELKRMGLMSPDGVVNAAVAEWIRVVCFPERWLDLRFVGRPGLAVPTRCCAASSPVVTTRPWSRCATLSWSRSPR
ncbi:espG family protein [Mycobacterium xenopi 3993]|nr:espG family protein [Mycobacterium xenopi 3993]